MKYLVIESHPYDGSFNRAAAGVFCGSASDKGHEVRRIDLVKDNFNPVMSPQDLWLWRSGESNDPLVKKYQGDITWADVLVFIFPIWWGSQPAILKGFIEKVFLPGFSYRYDENRETVGMLGGKKAIVITTMQTPIEVFNDYFKNPVEGALIKDALEGCDVEVIKFFQIDNIAKGGREYAESMLNEIAKIPE